MWKQNGVWLGRQHIKVETVAILQTTFKVIFMYNDCCILISISVNYVPYGPTNKSAMVKYHGLVRQAIIWINGGPVTYASYRLSELTH